MSCEEIKYRLLKKNSGELAFAQFFRVSNVQAYSRLNNSEIKTNQWLLHEPIDVYQAHHHTE